MPKCMIPVANKPVLEHIADHMNKHGIWRIVVNLHSFPEVVMKHFGQRFLYLYEPVPMGEFATLALVRRMFREETVVMMNGDTLSNVDLSAFFKYGTPPNGRLYDVKSEVSIGTSIWRPGYDLDERFKVNYWWQDMGTPEGLKKARKHYDKK